MSRYESKYLVSAAVRTALMPLLRSRMHVDSHGSIAPGTYPIYSIYMDTDDLASYHEKIDGLLKRTKVRLRHYKKHGGPYFLELKSRINSQIVKTRAVLADEEFELCTQGRTLPDERGDPAIIEYNKYVRDRQLRPKAIIGYTRQAFESNLPGNLRVTFDYNISVQQCAYKGDNFRAEYRSMHPQWYVLEIKFDRFMPRWIGELTQRFSFSNESVCKYTMGLNRLLKLGRLPECAPYENNPLFGQPEKNLEVKQPSRNETLVLEGHAGMPSQAAARLAQ